MTEHGADIAVPFRQVTRTARQNIQIVLDLMGNVGGSERLEPAYRQLNCQRHPLHQPADFRHAPAVFGQVEIAAYPARPVQKQLHRAVIFNRLVIFSLGIGQARDLPYPLFLQVERRAGGGEDFQAGGDRQDVGNDVYAAQEMLKIIQHQQETLSVFLAQIRKKLFAWAAVILLETKRRGFGNGRQQIVGPVQRGERHKKDAVGERSALV